MYIMYIIYTEYKKTVYVNIHLYNIVYVRVYIYKYVFMNLTSMK